VQKKPPGDAPSRGESMMAAWPGGFMWQLAWLGMLPQLLLYHKCSSMLNIFLCQHLRFRKMLPIARPPDQQNIGRADRYAYLNNIVHSTCRVSHLCEEEAIFD